MEFILYIKQVAELKKLKFKTLYYKHFCLFNLYIIIAVVILRRKAIVAKGIYFIVIYNLNNVMHNKAFYMHITH